jgi:hypothetical protein
VPEHSAFVDEGIVLHGWRCEACDHVFTTTVEIGRLAA